MMPVAPPNAAADEDEVRRSVEAVRHAVVDGAVADGVHDAHPALQVLTGRGLPLVRSVATDGGPCVFVDDRAAGRALGGHLAALGHRDVAVVVDHARGTSARAGVDESSLYPYARSRLAGLRESLGPGARVTVVDAGSNTPAGGRHAGELVLSSGPRPSAVAAVSDVLALGVLDVARARGLTAGREVSVTGFDDAPAAAAAGLTTVRQPVQDKGRVMGRMLLDPTFTDRRVHLPTELVVRRSTGPATQR